MLLLNHATENLGAIVYLLQGRCENDAARCCAC
jgi:hypothetical protein